MEKASSEPHEKLGPEDAERLPLMGFCEKMPVRL